MNAHAVVRTSTDPRSNGTALREADAVSIAGPLPVRRLAGPTEAEMSGKLIPGLTWRNTAVETGK